MEQINKNEAKKRANRSLSITFFIASIILILCSLVIIGSCVQANIERKHLVNTKQMLEAQKDDFQITNDHLKDPNYYEIYVREEYQFDGKNIIRLPRK